MMANQTQCSWFQQRSVIKYLLAEKCKLCEIYKRIYDVYKACFDKKNIYKWTKLFKEWQNSIQDKNELAHLKW